MKMNPVYKREMMVSSRSMRMPLIITVFNGILAVVALLNMYSNVVQVRLTADVQYSSFLDLYEFVATIEFVMLMFIMPAITSGTISGERERRTLDLMLTTGLNSWEIVSGKLGAALVTMFLVIVSSFPVFALVFVYGGITGRDVLFMLLCFVTSALFAGSLGICCSSLFKRSTVATVAAYGVLALAVAGTLAVNSFAYSMARMNWNQSGYTMGMIGEQTVNSGGFLYTLLVNPAATFLLILQGQTASGAGGVLEMYGTRPSGLILDHWLVFSIVIQLALSWVFVAAAVKMVRRKGNGGNAENRVSSVLLPRLPGHGGDGGKNRGNDVSVFYEKSQRRKGKGSGCGGCEPVSGESRTAGDWTDCGPCTLYSECLRGRRAGEGICPGDHGR